MNGRVVNFFFYFVIGLYYLFMWWRVGSWGFFVIFKRIELKGKANKCEIYVSWFIFVYNKKICI